MNFYNLHRVISSNNMLNNGFSKESQLYIFTTENIRQYITHMNIDKVLCPTSSGDHAIFSLLNGANKIDTFDINEYSKYLLNLKISAIKNLDKEAFIEFFMLKNKGINEQVLNKKVYKKYLRNSLDKDSKLFFDTCYDICKTGLRLRRSGLFLINNLESSSQVLLCSYIDDLKELKKRIKILENSKFYNTDIFNLEIEDLYTSIFLSNIQDYVDKDLYKDFIKNKLINNLTDKATLQTEYYYGNGDTISIKNLSNKTYYVDGYSTFIFEKKGIKDKCLILEKR